MLHVLYGAVIFCLCYTDGVVSEEKFNRLLMRNPIPQVSYQETKPPEFSKRFRLSERKCMEYIWQMNNRLKELRRLECRTDMQAITEGKNAIPGEFPHMGAVGWRWRRSWKFLCGSSLISAKFVITAAHCTYADLPELSSTRPSIVRFGITDLEYTDSNIPSVDITIKNIINHPNFTWRYKYYDISLFELDRELTFNKYLQPACLWVTPNFQKITKKIIISGFGATEPENPTSNTKLKSGVVHIIDTNICNRLLEPYCNRYWCKVEDHQMCAGNLRGGVDTCFGDSGGPLMFQLLNTSEGAINVVVGVTSIGMTSNTCGQNSTPGIYTKIYSFIDWIESIVWPGEE